MTATRKGGEAAAAGAQIVCLQELFAGHYPAQEEDFRRFDEAEPIPGPTSDAIAAAAPAPGAGDGSAWSWAVANDSGADAALDSLATFLGEL